MKGKFLTIEGTEGVGKSTNIEFIRSYFAKKEIDLIVTREPGGTPFAEEIREVLLKKRDECIDPTAELLAVFSARAQHFHTVILPALNKGTWVLSDRFTDATYAYQGYGRGLSLSMIEELEDTVQKSLRPDLVLLLDIDVEVGLNRASERAELDRFESEEISFFNRVRQGYIERAKQYPDRYAIIDAEQKLDDVQRDLFQVLESLTVKVF